MQDYLGTAAGGLDWGVCSGCHCADVACRCVGGVVAAGAGGGKRRVLVRVEGGIVVRARQAVGAIGLGVADVGVFPAYVIVGAAAARLAAGVELRVDRVAYRRRFSWVVGGPVLVSQAIPNILWTFENDRRLVQFSHTVLADRDVAQRAARQKVVAPAEYVPLYTTYLRTLDRFVGNVRVHLLARNDVAMSRRGDCDVPELVWVDTLRREQATFPLAQLSAFLRYGIDKPRNDLEERAWTNLARYCRVIRSQLPLFVESASVLPPLAAWRMVAVAFAGAEVGCCSAEEHRRWIWLVRLVQGASPVFCSPHLAGLALLAGNRHQLSGLLACWVGVTGEVCHFSGPCNLVYVTRAVAWLHLRPSVGGVGSPNLAPRANLLELSLMFPARLVPEAVAVAQRPPVFDADLLDGTDHHVADCDYVDVARANYDFAPSVRRVSYDLAPVVDGARGSLSDGCVDGAAYTSDLPLSDWETAYHHCVLFALPWVLGFLSVAPFGLDAAGVFMPERGQEEYESEESVNESEGSVDEN